MADFWCWLVGCGGHHASDVSRAAPEISGDALTNALILAVGMLLILKSARTKSPEVD